MTWDDMEDVLFDGTPEEIAALRCPDCGGPIDREYSPTTNSVRVACNGCGIVSLGHGCEKVPNFART